MTAPLPPGSTLGIVGGGQLGRMLAMAAARLGYRTLVLEPDPDCPAAQVAGGHIAAPYADAAALDALADACAAITFEFENVDEAAAAHLAARRPLRPGPRALAVAQDRLAEKTFLNEAGLPTAPFRAVDGADGLRAALADLGGRGILKTRRLGYDGKGQVRLTGAPGDPWPEAALAAIGHAPAILEGLVPFSAELSVILARGADGASVAYEPGRNTHQDGILTRTQVPGGFAPEVRALALSMATRLADALDYVGVLGLELFLVEGGELGGGATLLANEFAPRVHNSGHWTEAGCAVCQFENHIRAVAGLPLGDPVRHADCTMENLIGADVERLPALCARPGARVHLYGKRVARPGRKMGHVTHLFPLGAAPAIVGGPEVAPARPRRHRPAALRDGSHGPDGPDGKA